MVLGSGKNEGLNHYHVTLAYHEIRDEQEVAGFEGPEHTYFPLHELRVSLYRCLAKRLPSSTRSAAGNSLMFTGAVDPTLRKEQKSVTMNARPASN